MRIRKNVWKLPAWDPILLWYARAVAEMQRRPIDDPTSWRYQAAIHEYVRARDPFADPADVLPPAAAQRRFWNQCQHGSWFFLPWHRIYLAYFEQIVGATVVALGGPADWGLPYWNYSDSTNPKARSLPPAFFAATIPGTTDPNPLRVPARRTGANTGQIIATTAAVDLRCLTEPDFQAQPPGGSTGFGGPKTGFQHSGSRIGQAEGTPHGTMHNAVGGPGGFMGGFNTAALDPIFWLHHANIDRLWAVWRAMDPLHVDPVDAAWLTGQPFEFHDAGGSIVSHTASQFVITTTSPLPYDYDDVSNPLAIAPPVGVTPAAAAVPGGTAMVIPEMVGASDEPIDLTGQRVVVNMPVSAPTGPARVAAAAADARPQRMFLNIENIKGSAAGTSYEVYVNVPAGEDPRAHQELYAGLLPLFGLAEATRGDQDHPGDGLHYALEVTDIIRRLSGGPDFDSGALRLTFVPQEEPAAPSAPAAAAAAAAEPVRIGRVSLYVA
jgi:tyrosinase